MDGKELNTLKSAFGKNFIGPDEINSASKILHFLPHISSHSIQAPKTPITELLNYTETHYLFYLPAVNRFGDPLTLMSIKRQIHELNGTININFYNQDWYHYQAFANEKLSNDHWVILRKEIYPDSKGKLPTIPEKLPKALEITLAFFLYGAVFGEIIYGSQYIWCQDKDDYGDMIYVGHYNAGINSKNGFEIHRHLSIKSNYGCV